MTAQNSQDPSEQCVKKSDLKADFTSQEKFELLSAYLDDEITDAERCLVDLWLASDAELRSHYHKQLQLRKALKKWL